MGEVPVSFPASGQRPMQLPLLLVTMCATLGPFASHSIIPLLPRLQEAFAVSYAQMQLAVSLYLVALAAGQLVMGSLSDRYGPGVVLVAGLALFVLTSVALGLGSGITLFLGLRVLQGLAGSTAMVIARALIGASNDGRMVARNSMLMASLSMATMLAPFLGGAVASVFGWRMVFLLTGAAGIVLLAFLLHRQRGASAPAEKSSTSGFAAALRILGNSRSFACCVALACTGVGAFYFILGATPYLTTRLLGLSEVENGAWFMVVAFGVPLGAVISTRLSPRLGSERTMLVGCGIMLAATAIAVLLATLGPATSWSIFGPVFFVCLGMALATSNAQALAFSAFPAIAGTAAGLTGALQFSVGALCSMLGAIIAEGTVSPAIMFLCTGVLNLASLLLAVLYPRLRGR